MSTSPSKIDTSDSESSHSSRAPSPPPFQGPPAASTRSKKSMAQAQSTASPGQATLQPPSASTRAKRLSVQSTKSSSGIKPSMVQPTESVARPHHNIEERFRLLWAVHPIQGMRKRFRVWNQALSENNAGLKAMLKTLSATVEGVEPEARGTKRKAEDEAEDENEQ